MSSEFCKLLKNDNPVWTLPHIEHFSKYSDVYGLELTNSKIDQEIDLLKLGSPSLRYSTETECYDIYTETGELAGDITIIQVSHIPEVSIVIFDQFSAQGLAQKALRALIDMNRTRFTTIEAVVKASNPAASTAKHILESVGFTFSCSLPGGGLLFVLNLI